MSAKKQDSTDNKYEVMLKDNGISDNSSEKSKSRSKLFNNSRYLTISAYAILIILVGIVIWKFFDNFSLLVKGFKSALSIISPFILGAFIAFILNPMVKYFRDIFFTKYIKMKDGRLKTGLSILFTYLIFFGLIIVLLAYVIPQIIESLKDLTLQIPQWFARIEKYLRNFQQNHPNINLDYDKIYKELENTSILQNTIEALSNLIPNLVTFIFNTSLTIIRFIINFLISIMVSIYIIADRKSLIHNFKRMLYAFLPAKVTSTVIDVLKETNNIFSGFIFGKAIDSIIIGLLCFILMTIFRFDYAILISVVVGITNMIPYFGPYMGGAFGVIILIIISPLKALFFFILILALQQFDGLFLGPKILGKSIGTKPIWIIFSITVGGSLYGLIGMFLGVPVFAVISYLVNRVVTYRLGRKHIEFDEDITDLSHHIKKNS